MATETITRYILTCDGCEAKHGDPEGFLTAFEARAAGYTEGWRFPPQVNKDGSASKFTSDACPECMQDWKPQGRAMRHRRRLLVDDPSPRPDA